MFYLNIKCVHFEQKEPDKIQNILFVNLDSIHIINSRGLGSTPWGFTHQNFYKN